MSILRMIGGLLFGAGLTSFVVAADSRPDVSQIINKADASAILGEAVKDPSPRNGDGADGYYSKCNYYSVNRGKSLVIRLQLPGPNAVGPQKELQLLAANGSMEKVSGIGDAAQMFTGGVENGFASRVLMLYVAKGNAFLTIGLGGFVDGAAAALEKAKSIAQKLLEHL